MSVRTPTPTDTRAPAADLGVDATPAVTTASPRRRLRLRRILPIGAVIVLLIVAFFGFSMYRENAQYVSTDNAELSGRPIQVGSMTAGRLEQVNVRIGSSVKRNEVVASVALPSQTGVAQSGQPKLGFLGSADSHVDITSPVDGIVIGVAVADGATLAPGQQIVSIIDPRTLWVNANVDETNIGRVKVGQVVQVHVDALGTDVPGRVEAITPATAASFALLPTNNSSGNFTKVTQLVPVRIAVNLGNRPALLGTSVEVKIRVQD